MKDMPIKRKLLVAFLIVIALTAVVGVVGIVGMLRINKGDTDMYNNQTSPMPHMATILETLQKMRVNCREYLVAIAEDNPQRIEDTQKNVQQDDATLQAEFPIYYSSIVKPDSQKMFNDTVEIYNKQYLPFMQKCYDLAKQGNDDEIVQEIVDIAPAVDTIIANFEKVLEDKVELAEAASAANDGVAKAMLTVIIIILIISIVAAFSLAMYISGLVSTPITALAAFLSKASSTGDITLSKHDEGVIAGFATLKDEIGKLIGSAAAFVSRIGYVSQELERLSQGDLTSDITVLSNTDVMGSSLKKVVDNLNDMFSEVHMSTEQVANGSSQVAEGAQALAQGSTQQTAAVQELSISIENIALKTKDNAAMALTAANLAKTITGSVEKGSRQMDEMTEAVRDINIASQNISKIIKVIDDIAFQTNILALNAAVEAARAGQHGKGFAVVAEEVRNLAAKSAEAAKETSDMITNSMEKAELGAKIASDTAASLNEIVAGINESDTIVNKIATSSEEQTSEIGMINVGITQVGQVIQQNSATAQESAAAAEEMSGQSDILNNLISKFKLKSTSKFR